MSIITTTTANIIRRLRIPCIAMGCLFLGISAFAQSSETIWIGLYNRTSGRVNSGLSNYIPAHNHAQQMYPGYSNQQIFQEMLSSNGYVYGFSADRKTRGMDIIEDRQYNFVDPAEVSDWNSTSQKIYWTDFYSTNPNSTYNWSLILRNGEHAGESFFHNPNVLAMGDDSAILLNADGSFSRYGLNGQQVGGVGGWQTFGGGYYAGQRFEDVLVNMIGFEENELVFLEGDSTIVRYGIGGNVSVVTEFSFAYVAGDKGPDLSQYTLGDIIDGKVDGFSYIGWDSDGPVIIGTSLIPEPGTVATIAGTAALVMAFARRRKKA